MKADDKIYIAGHTGLVGSAVVRLLRQKGYTNLLYQTREKLDLTDRTEVDEWFAQQKPRFVIIAAARVGGILDNDTHPVDFLYQNLQIATNIIHAAHEYKVEKLLNLGSACIYPKESQQPIKEEYFMTGKLEPTNEAYAIAKIAAIKLCQAYHRQYGDNFISAMPTNLYGPGDTFNNNYAHVLPALLHKLVVARDTNQPFVKVWGSGKPRREFMFVDDLARALLLLMEKYDSPEIINVGTGEDINILDLVKIIKTVVGYTGDIVLDSTKPDGMPLRRLDVSRLRELGYQHEYTLQRGLEETHEWYVANVQKVAGVKQRA